MMVTDYKIPSFLGFVPAGFRSGQRYVLPLVDRFLPQSGCLQVSLGGLRLSIDSTFPNERLIAFCGKNILGKYARSPLGCLIEQLSKYESKGFVDIGSHMGFYSIWAKKCGFECTMIEPERDAFAFLQRNPNLGEAFPVALADSDGEMLFSDSETGATSSLIGNPQQEGQGTVVSVRRSGSFLACSVPNPENLGLVKIDVEGVECRVLSGLSDFLEIGRPLIWCEVRGGLSPRAPNTCVSAAKIMDEFNYDAFLPKGAGRFKPFHLSDAVNRGVFDVLFAPKNDRRIKIDNGDFRIA